MKLRTISLLLGLLAMVLVAMPHSSYGRSPEALPTNSPVTSGAVLSAPTMPGHGAAAIAESAVDSLCFLRQADGTIVDLSSICGVGSTAPPLPERTVPSGTGALTPRLSEINPAMQITPPNDPGVLYLSGSGANDSAAPAASQAEQQPTR